MAKRFTDTEKWKKPFIRGLQGPYKLLWLYICDDCDHAGIWKDQLDDFNRISGSPLDYDKIIINFEGRMIPLNDETFLIPKFILFQYTNFNSEKNNAHKGVMRSLDSFGVTYEQVASFVRSEKTSFGNKINKNKPLVSPYKGSQDKEQEQDKVKVMVKEQDKGLEIKFDPKVFMSGMEDL